MHEPTEVATVPSTVLRDTREQRPWSFDPFPVETRDVTLSTGDYAVPTHCSRDPATDTYVPRFAVERKSCHDFITALTRDRDRFESELQRAARWPRPLPVVVETSRRRIRQNRGCMAWREVHPNQVMGTVAAWTDTYNVTFQFATSRRRAQRLAFHLLSHVRPTRIRGLDEAVPGADRTDDAGPEE